MPTPVALMTFLSVRCLIILLCIPWGRRLSRSGQLYRAKVSVRARQNGREDTTGIYDGKEKRGISPTKLLHLRNNSTIQRRKCSDGPAGPPLPMKGATRARAA